jgi:formylglycine-generating enzyme
VNRYCRSFGVVTLVILAASFVGSAQAVTIATVPVGSPGNAPKTLYMGFSGFLNFGDIPYNYRIGTYDVTNAQYAEFLNAKASAADPFGLWNTNMDPSNLEGAISRSGSGPYIYSVKPGYANKPVAFASWYEAVRFVNWLQNGQGNGDTESGTYLITGGGNNAGTVQVPDAAQRMTWASTNSFHWLLPSENEWFKAAYYNPLNATYYDFPFQSNSPPQALAPPGNANSGNLMEFPNLPPAFNYDGTGSYYTDVGAYPASQSPFGAFDMGGDEWQWNDSAIGTSRGQRGGYYGSSSSDTAASSRGSRDPSEQAGGFRVASIGGVPEPSTGLLAVLACGVIWLGRKRFKSSACHRIT